jgi:DUF4097 and DUF4098 domain-containing protein YvlB
VEDAKNTVTVQTTSGNVEAINAGGAVDLKVTSGDIRATLVTVNKVKAQTTSGDVDVEVPRGSYNVNTYTGSGDAAVVGITTDLSSSNTIDVRTGSGDANISALP